MIAAETSWVSKRTIALRAPSHTRVTLVKKIAAEQGFPASG
jgi:hypothetical protein